MTIIKRGLVGKNISTRQNQYAFYRQCLTSQALSNFGKLAQNAGIETIAHLVTVIWVIRESFMGNEPLLAQTCYICNYMRNLIHATAWKYVAATRNINNYLTKFPPNYESGQKVSAAALLDPLSAHLPKRSRTLLTEHRYNPGNGTIGRFINLCERAESAESIEVDKIDR